MGAYIQGHQVVAAQEAALFLQRVRLLRDRRQAYPSHGLLGIAGVEGEPGLLLQWQGPLAEPEVVDISHGEVDQVRDTLVIVEFEVAPFPHHTVFGFFVS